ncbi:hypothetical protein M4Z63_20100, partial [Escherichia coli]|nr:hypothetical protein [Escherichia coli]
KFIHTWLRFGEIMRGSLRAEYVQFAEQQRRLKEAEGEKDIAGLLQWNKESKK